MSFKVMKFHMWEHKPPILYRQGTSDEWILRVFSAGSIAENEEYHFPGRPFFDPSPKVIADIGANIGISTVWLANRYPKATIHAFEPIKENLELLGENTMEYGNVQVHPYGLGAQDSIVTFYHSDSPENKGGFSMFPEGSDTSKKLDFQIKNASQIFDQISGIDMVKIDAEGAEWDIFNSLSKVHLDQIKWVTGELHGQNDIRLMQLLKDAGFNLGFSKHLNSRNYPFVAGKVK